MSTEEKKGFLKGPGALLKELRETKALQLKTVAEHLCLSVQSILDIEADDYKRFSAEVYLLGYLRAYAKLLEVEENVVLEAYRAVGTPLHRTAEFATFKLTVSPRYLREPANLRTRWWRWLLLPVVVLSGALVLYMWHKSTLDPEHQAAKRAAIVIEPPVVAVSDK